LVLRLKVEPESHININKAKYMHAHQPDLPCRIRPFRQG
jgi:hypothetical protein